MPSRTVALTTTQCTGAFWSPRNSAVAALARSILLSNSASVLTFPPDIMRASSPLAAAAMSAIELPAVASLARPPNFPALPRSDLSCGRMRFSSKLRTVASPLVLITSLRASSVRLATMCPPAIPKSSGTNLSWPCCSLRWLERLSSGQSPATTCSPRKRTSASPAPRRSRL